MQLACATAASCPAARRHRLPGDAPAAATRASNSMPLFFSAGDGRDYFCLGVDCEMQVGVGAGGKESAAPISPTPACLVAHRLPGWRPANFRFSADPRPAPVLLHR